jgi:hypothetical protein
MRAVDALLAVLIIVLWASELITDAEANVLSILWLGIVVSETRR